MSDTLVIGVDDTLYVDEGDTLYIDGTLINRGTIHNGAAITADAIINYGTIDDDGDYLHDMKATAISTSQIKIEWESSRPAGDLWRIERRLYPSGTFDDIVADNITQRQFIDTPPEANVKYEYRVSSRTIQNLTPAEDVAWLTAPGPVDTVPDGVAFYAIEQAVIPWSSVLQAARLWNIATQIKER